MTEKKSVLETELTPTSRFWEMTEVVRSQDPGKRINMNENQNQDQKEFTIKKLIAFIKDDSR